MIEKLTFFVDIEATSHRPFEKKSISRRRSRNDGM